MENSFLNLPVDDEDSLLQLQGASVSYRIAMGPQQGQKVFTLQTLPTSNEGEKCENHNVSIIACIIDVHVIQKILNHLDKKYPRSAQPTKLPPLRAPPKKQ